MPVGTCISPLLELDAEQSTAADIQRAVSSFNTDEATEEQRINRGTHDMRIADLRTPAATALVARGGVGGRGSISKEKGAIDLRYANDASQGPTWVCCWSA